MRTSNLRLLVIVTAGSFLRTVYADPNLSNIDGPSSISISPSTLTAGQPYEVSWEGCSSGCTAVGVTLITISPVGVLSAVTQSTAVQTGRPSACGEPEGGNVGPVKYCATGTAPTLLDPAKTYEIIIGWQSSADGLNPMYATGDPLPIQPIDGSTESVVSQSSSSAINASATSSSVSSQALSASSAALTTTAAASAPIVPSIPSATSTPASSTSSSSSLSTGAKVGIAIGTLGFALLVIIAALFIWRRSRQRRQRVLPDGTPYSHEAGSMTRDLTAEKEMHVINSPVDTLHNNGYSSIPPAAPTAVAAEPQGRSTRASWNRPDDHQATAAAVPYTDSPGGAYGMGEYGDASSSPTYDAQAHTAAAAAGAVAGAGAGVGGGGAIQRKPVGATPTAAATMSGPTQHLREPGMSDEEVARLEEEERRLDEAIAEAERRRQRQS